ncbi:SIMPL domain-containing protein [Halovenus salina]|uniref:SIMPL domain-containing protein n=1 Tax=Halovenus salina TaxID=1510225 RepID=A0ABD5W657_9EURY|nr:SIMPL domain-containing protein [Halovenus salina]
MRRNYTTAAVVGLTVLAVALVGAMAVSGAVGADSVQESSVDERISVSATGSAEAQPDLAKVQVVIKSEGEDPETIREELANGAEELEAALNEEDVDYKTTDFEIREPYRDQPDSPDYVGRHAFEITVNDPDDVGSIVDVATSAGAEIQRLDMTLSEEKRQELRDQAIESAMDDARHQAETIATAGDLVVNDVITVDASQRGYRPVTFESALQTDGADGAATSIQTGQVSVSYSVSVTYDAAS